MTRLYVDTPLTIFQDPIASALSNWTYTDESTGRSHTIHRASPINATDRNVVYVAERHGADPADPIHASVFDYVTIKARWPELEDGHIYPHRKETWITTEKRQRENLEKLPFIGRAPHCASLPMDQIEELSGKYEIDGESRLLLLITPLRDESFGGTVPLTLADAIPPYGCHTQRELSNWFVLAINLARALWGIHARGFAHRDIKPENIVLRTDHGYWRDITIIDFEHVTRDEQGTLSYRLGTPHYFRPDRLEAHRRQPEGEYCGSAACEDLYALGITLLEVLRGGCWRDSALQDMPKTCEGAQRHVEQLQQWAGKPGRRSLEIRSRAKTLCYQHLLLGSRPEMSPSTPHGNESAPRSESLHRFDEFLSALEKLQIRQHRCRLHTVGTSGVNEPAPASPGDSMLMELTALSQLVNRDELKEWCARYIASTREAHAGVEQSTGMSPPEPGVDPSRAVQYGVEMLRAGHGHAAEAWFAMLARDHGASLKAEELTRMLRLLVGVLWGRRGCFGDSDELLEHYERHAEVKVRWWAGLLRQKLAHHRRVPPPHYCLDTQGEPPDLRAQLWLLVVETLPELRRRNVDENIAVRLRSAISGSHSAYETAFVALCIARALASGSDVSRWRRAVSALVMAANHAATGRLPYEYAASLRVAARLVCNAFDDRELGRSLHEDGFDDEEALVIAGRCASLAAEIYHRLDASHLNVVALEQAAAAYLRCPSLERRTEGMRYLGLARSNCSLWRERRRLGGSAAGRNQRERSRDGLKRWRQAVLEREQAAVATHPGAVLAHHFYGRYSKLYLALWDGKGGLAVEFVSPESAARVVAGKVAGDRSAVAAVQSGAATARLVAEWRTRRGSDDATMEMVDIGCGIGDDTATVMMKEQAIASAVGVDISEWHVQRARQRHTAHEPKQLRFERLDFVEIGEHYPGRFGLVLARDSLYHATDYPTTLRSIRRSLRPGGHLLLTDWVQTKPVLPARMRRLASSVWICSLPALAGYADMVRAAGFDVEWSSLESNAMHAYFTRTAQCARAMQGELTALDRRMRIPSIFDTLAFFSDPEDGMISWLFLIARAVP
ncbi:MAG: methyltransferase domain-containing protein [Proteobacteria bacterium]|nr:methyltransferase domain-containing protein [Pseudomonadota bacterium]